MLTRSAFKLLQENESIKCRGCDQYYGTKENMYLCSQCCGMNMKQKTPIKKMVKNSLNLYQVSLLEPELEKVFYFAVEVEMVGIFEDDGQSTSTALARCYVKVMRQLGKRFLLRREAADKVSNLLYAKLSHLPNYYIVSQTLACLTFMPWLIDTSKNGWHPSAVCYYGNMGEEPRDQETVDRITQQCIRLPYGSPFYNPNRPILNY